MELTQIRYFLEVADTKHMTNSAKNLHITQPALTQAIRRLEEDLGVPLFAAKGQYHADRVRKISSEKADAADEAAGRDSGAA